MLDEEEIFSGEKSVQNTKWKNHVGLLLTGQALSLIGSSIVQYAVSWYLVLNTNSGIIVMMTMVFTCLPQAFLSLFGGVWVDRWNRKLLVMLPDVVIAAITLGLAICIARGVTNIWLILIVLAARSAGAGIQTPAVQSFIPQITPDDKLLRVNSINGTVQSVNMIAAPAISAILVSIFPLWSILLLDIATAIVGVGFVAIIKEPAKSSHTATVASERTDVTLTAQERGMRGIWNDFMKGIAYAWEKPVIRCVIISYALVCFVNTAPMNLTPLLMNRGFRGQSLDLGFIVLKTATDKLAADEFAWSLGMVLGGVLLSSLGNKFIHNNMAAIAVAFTSMGVLTASLGLSTSLQGYVFVDFMVGMATSFAAAPVFTLLQNTVASEMQGRIFGLLTMFSTVGTPLGLMVVGPLADVVPLQGIFIVGGLLTIPVGIWILKVLALKNYETGSW